MRPESFKFLESGNFYENLEKQRKDITDLDNSKLDGGGGCWLGEEYWKSINKDYSRLTVAAIRDGLIACQSW